MKAASIEAGDGSNVVWMSQFLCFLMEGKESPKREILNVQLDEGRNGSGADGRTSVDCGRNFRWRWR